ncbi:MAG TPA: ABC transporter substrate-binding protein, partial [Paracoccaceae bacterium]|nr:ABC transporter substrate-binding protein [Paracoccaceae bacterium]
DRQRLIEAVEAMSEMPLGPEHPQGVKLFRPELHQVFGQQHVSRVTDGVLDVVHTTSIEDGLYESDTNYLERPF